MSDSKIHPALMVSNIRNAIPILLDQENGQYSTWAELFKIHCRVHQVLHHIIPSPRDEKDKGPAIDPAVESHLDACVLQWIYGTITIDLVQSIMEKDCTTHRARENLKRMFEDNKNSRAVILQNRFSNIQLNDFANVFDYCQELKIVADQLANFGSPVTDHNPVLQLVAGLNENYDNAASYINQQDPRPTFYSARSRLTLEASQKAKQASVAANSINTAFVSQSISLDVQAPTTQAAGKGGRGGQIARSGGRGGRNNSSGQSSGQQSQRSGKTGRGGCSSRASTPQQPLARFQLCGTILHHGPCDSPPPAN